ncbi:MAG: ATP-binding cassette domain-containing protein, partial [Anaerovorax sp.]
MKEEAYITANQVTYTYGKGKHKKGTPPFSLGPVNLELYQQEITFVVGANGSGKSTLGKLLTGIYPPQRGQVFIDGVNGKNLSLGQMGKKIGYLWQKPEMQ